MLSNSLMVLLTVLTFLSMWAPSKRVWQVSYGALFLVGLLSSAFTYMAILPLIALVVLLSHYQKDQKYSFVAGLLALLIGLALGLHVVPGFNNFQYASEITLSTTASSFDLWFNWDKSMFGLLALGIVLHGSLIRSGQDALQTIKSFLPLAVMGCCAIYAMGLLIGYSAFDWTPASIFFPWAVKNIVFAVLAEEVFFRGIVQHQLTKHLKCRHAGHIAVVIAGIFFGIAHFGGGIEYVLLASLTGMLYGYTYFITGRIEAPIITHFLFNTGHFLFLTYPYSAS